MENVADCVGCDERFCECAEPSVADAQHVFGVRGSGSGKVAAAMPGV